MQRVASFLPSWEKTKTSSKKGFDKAYAVVDKLGPPINRLSNKVGSEAFWPTTLDIESDKAARILKSFCKDGFYAEEDRPATEGVPKGKQKVLKKIPEEVIRNAVGLAIFTTMRTGLWISGAGGSGVLIARQENGEWSPPSGIMLHTVGLGFLVGVDIYDCVLVINNRKALDSFVSVRATLGGEISAVAGPMGVGGILENDGKWKQANRPVFSYLKSRGLYAGVQIDGTVIIERTDENERFYGERIGVTDILAGKSRHPPYEIKKLMETVKAAEGRTDVDEELIRELDKEPAPGDVEISSPTKTTFGVPEADDPDPFGVLALEKAGLEIREAGSKSRPSSTQFEFNPSPSSPIYRNFHRQSMDTLVNGSNRDSTLSSHSTSLKRTSSDRATQTVDMSTQTDGLPSPRLSPLRSSTGPIREVDEVIPEPVEVDYTKIDLGPYSKNSQELDGTTINESPLGSDTRGRRGSIGSAYDSSDDDDDEEPVIFEAASAQATVITPRALKVQGGLVDIPKRPPPPPLPQRSSARNSRAMTDRSSQPSPTKDGFEEVDLHGGDHRRSFLSDRPSSFSSNGAPPPLPARRSLLQTTESAQSEPVKTSDTQGNTLEDELEKALKEQHLDDISPVSTNDTPKTPELVVESPKDVKDLSKLKVIKDEEELDSRTSRPMPGAF